jgi:uncharacterized phage-like protein YoqJ
MSNNHPYKIIPDRITKLAEKQIFVFGSNTEGRHGAGSALFARQYCNAEYGNPQGRQGQSWAIATKDLNKGIRSIPLPQIKSQIEKLVEYAKTHPELEFLTTRIGCNLAGYTDLEIASLISNFNLPPNIWLPQEFVDCLIEDKPTLKVAFTGNSHKKFDEEGWKQVRNRLEGMIVRACDRSVEWGYKRIQFYSGMALGVDSAAVEIVLGLKDKYPIEINLTAAVHCINQDAKWNNLDKQKYHWLLSQCDAIKFISNLLYQEAGGIKCLNARNRWIVNQIKNAHDMMIAIWDGQAGGTANFIADAAKLNRRVIIYNWVTNNYQKLGNW